MRTEDFVRGLESDDFLVRSTCLSILSKQYESPPEAALSAWRACLKYGAEKAFETPGAIRGLTLDDRLYSEILDQVKISYEDSSDVDMAPVLLWWLGHAPIPLLQKHSKVLKSLPIDKFETRFGNVCAQVHEMVDRKLKFAQLSAAQLRSVLDEKLGECPKCKGFPHELVQEFDSLAEAVGDNSDVISDEELIEWLKDPSVSETDHVAGWKAGFAIILSTTRRLEVATPYILKHFEQDWDWYDQLISNFVKSTSCEASLRTLLDEFPNFKADSATLFLSEAIVECAPYPGIEALLIEMRGHCRDFMAEVFLSGYLAKLGTPGGKDAAYSFYKRYEDDPEVEEIPRLLHTVYYLQRDNPGNTEKFRKIVEANDKRAAGARESSPLTKLMKKIEARGDLTRTKAPVCGPFKVTNLEPEPLVGRNRPCPCGSGKKHKMCCMKKAAG